MLKFYLYTFCLAIYQLHGMEQTAVCFVEYNKSRHALFVRQLLDLATKKKLFNVHAENILAGLECTQFKKTIVKDIGSRPVGFINYQHSDATILGVNVNWLFGRQGIISALAIDPQETDKEHAKDLLNFAINDLKPKVHQITAHLKSEDAEKLFMGVGFQLVCAHPTAKEYMLRGYQ